MKVIPVAKRITKTAKKIVTAPVQAKKAITNPRYHYAYYYKYAKIHPNRMLFDSFNGRGISDSPYAVLQEMMRQGIADEYEIYFTSRDIERDQQFVEANGLPITLVDYFSVEYARILATAKYLLSNSSLPQYYIRRPEQVFVETWHGTPLKTLGKQIKNGMQSMHFAQHSFLQASVITFPNDFTRDVMMRDYNLENLYTGKLAMLGYPRNAIFMQQPDSGIREKYDLDSHTNYAYMPTWRGTSSLEVHLDEYARDIDVLLRAIDAQLDDTQRLYVNLHSMVASSITLDSYEHILPFPSDLGTYDFLTQMDVLITDYSSVMFDYALTRKPVVLFAYDMEEYLADRGMYLSITDLPFPIVKTVKELCALLSSESDLSWGEAHERFAEEFLNYDTADNARNVLDILLEREVPGVPIIDYAKNLDHTLTVVDALPQKSLRNIAGILQTSDPTEEVVLLKRAGFGPGKSTLVYENYLDKQFVFVTNQNFATLLESRLRKFSPTTEKRLQERNRLRMLGNVPTLPDARTGYCGDVAGTSYNDQVGIQLDAHTQVDGRTLYVKLLDPRFTPRKVILAYQGAILWDRDLTEAEVESRSATLDAFDLLCDSTLRARNGLRAGVCFIVKDEDTGMEYVSTLRDDRFDPTETDISKRYFAPIDFSEADWSGHIEYNEDGTALVPILNLDDSHTQVHVIPYDSLTGGFSLFFSTEGNIARAYYRPMATSISIADNRKITVRVKMPKGAYVIDRVVLANRADSSEMQFDLDFSVKEYASFKRVIAHFDTQGKTFDGIYWDFDICITEPNGTSSQLACYTGDALRHSFFFRNQQCLLADGNVLFPYSARRGRLAFTHRPYDKSDTSLTKCREWAAVAAYLLLLPYWKRRHIWLTYEKFCSLAEDNGFAFFQYCMDDAPEEARKHVYYVIKKDEPEYANVQQYGKNVVDFMSFRHMVYALAADIYVGSDAKTHLYQWRPKTNVIGKFMRKKKIFFLQHGVMAMKRVDRIMGAKGSTPMTYFLTSSKREQNIIVENFGYRRAVVPVLGLSRWDKLKDKSSSEAPTILLMPTWRDWLEGVDDETFMASDYYLAYSELIQNEELLALLERANATVKFFIHPKLSEQLKNFGSSSERIQLIELGDQPMNEVIMECSACITDYSSVAWDVLYQGKPVIYYQFDQARYLDEIGSYIDFETELPGPICTNMDDVVSSLAGLVDGGFALNAKYAKLTDQWYAYKDTNNRKRTYELLQQLFPFN